VDCGVGSYVDALSAIGCCATGMDESGAMLRRAAARTQGRVDPSSWVQADMRHVPFTNQFDFASLMSNGFAMLSDGIQHFDALLSIGFALKPHGGILIQLDNRERVLRHWKDASTETVGDYVISRKFWRDLSQGRYGWRESVTSPEGALDGQYSIRMFTAPEVEDLLIRAGFDRIEFFGSLDGEPYDMDSPVMVVKARKLVFSDIPSIVD
jgi:SAM-dependent methyltransferase